MKAFPKSFQIRKQDEKTKDYLCCYTGKTMAELVNIALVAGMYEPLSIWNRVIPYKITFSSEEETKGTTIKYKTFTYDLLMQISKFFDISEVCVPQLILGVALDLYLDGKIDYYMNIYNQFCEAEEVNKWGTLEQLGYVIDSNNKRVFPFGCTFDARFSSFVEPSFIENIMPIIFKSIKSERKVNTYGNFGFVAMPTKASDLLNFNLDLIKKQEQYREENTIVPKEYYESYNQLKYNKNKDKIIKEMENEKTKDLAEDVKVSHIDDKEVEELKKNEEKTENVKEIEKNKKVEEINSVSKDTENKFINNQSKKKKKNKKGR